MSPQELSTSRVATDAWDPYDVWLKRVKQPRDGLARPVDVAAIRAEPPADEHAGDTRAEDGRLLPGVS